MTWSIQQGDVLDRLREMPDESAQCCVTSPPYWGGLRDYGMDRQIGLEREPADYAESILAVSTELSRVMDSASVFWLNCGDVYAASGRGGGGSCGSRSCWSTVKDRKGFRAPPDGFKRKDLTLTPFLVAEAIRASGWYLRSVVIWRKQAATEPMRIDRPAVSHEYVFMFTKSETSRARNPGEPWWGHSVWSIVTDSDASHPAAMPSELARRCIACSTQEGDTVLDPFAGSGTTLLVAERLGRDSIGIELNPEYVAIAERRIRARDPMAPVEVAPGMTQPSLFGDAAP